MTVTTPPEDRFAIQDLLARYAWTLDTGDYLTYASLFTPDGVFIERGIPWRGREVLAEHVRELAGQMARGNRHHNTQVLFEEGDSQRCVLRSYSTHIAQPDASSPQVVRLQGWYRDIVVKVDGLWYFEERNWDVWPADNLTVASPPSR